MQNDSQMFLVRILSINGLDNNRLDTAKEKLMNRKMAIRKSPRSKNGKYWRKFKQYWEYNEKLQHISK